MGKGDRKTKKGKIAKGSFGVTRQRKTQVDNEVAKKPPKKEKKPAEQSSAKPKKAAVKKKETKKEEK